MEMFEQELENLLLNKSFDDLSVREKSYAITMLTEDEYTRYRVILKASIQSYKQDFDPILPNPSIKKNLKRALNAKHTKPLLSMDFNSLRWPQLTISLSMLGAACVVFALYFILPLHSTNTTKIQGTTAENRIEKKKVNKIQPTRLQIADNEIPKKTKVFQRTIRKTHYKVKPRIQSRDIITTKPVETDMLCLTTTVELIGLDLNPEEFSKPGMAVNIPDGEDSVN